MPKQMDEHFWGVLSELVKQYRLDLLELDLIDFTYVKHRKRIYLHVNSVQKNGKKIKLNSRARFI